MRWLSSNARLSNLNPWYTTIIVASLLLNACYVYEWHQHCSSSLLFPEHASQVGYNFYQYGSITRLYEFATYQDHGVVGTGEVLDRAPNMKDTIGYGVLLGLIWKLTGTTSFYWVILLQILLFTISLCLIFQALWWFYADRQKALFATFGVLAFLPATYLNVQPVKDMWSFYATTVVLWVIIGLMQKKIGDRTLLSAAIFFAVCQWMRSTVFGVLLALLVCGLPVFYFYFKQHVGVLKKLLTYFFIANVCVFWIPWMSYNKITFNRFFVGPTGLALLVSFADSPNRWGVECSEDWVGRHVQERYPDLGYPNETQEFDNAAKSIFIEYFKEEPLLYFKNLAKRILKLFIINLPWTAQFEDFWEYNIYSSRLEAFQQACRVGVFEAIRCCFFFLYVRLFLLFAYLGGLLMLILETQLVLPFLVAILVIGNYGEIISHIESKYLMQCYGLLGIFAGLFIFSVKSFLSKKLKSFSILGQAVC